ncbi:hypothetical protein [Paenibacillus abyssi]|uniref:NAD-dependent epimerase/dehydratase domain-containing protein n=1 Tax=Paenibacillus abyssi TaxID=1340531 RepID=A0A917CJ87_9BACL|nr:hypothetical protein [Paenibacillus abyssi]GGF90479.1 hypothetical protein GCM10010916_04800 [Paenibacillus abyssi]
MKILVLGGSIFFGKMLVQKLITKGIHDVTIATGGNKSIEREIASKARHLVIDRTEPDQMH